jgi:hypothetical protein
MKPIEVEIDNFGDGFVATISTEGTDFLFVGDDGNAAETPEAARLSPEWAAAQRIAEADRIVRALAEMNADDFHDLVKLIEEARTYANAK